MIDPEEIRRLIAWVLCATMPPNDEDLRAIYADDVTLESLAVGHGDLLELSAALDDKFNIPISINALDSWETVGDVIRFVQSKFEIRNSKIRA